MAPASTPFEINSPTGPVIRGNIHLPMMNRQIKAPCVVICHGFKGFKDWGFFPFIADGLADAGFVTFRFNFSHNGVGDDPETFTRLDLFAVNTFSNELADLRAVLDAVESGSLPHAERYDGGHVGLLGHSRGAAAALLVGSLDPRVKALATWAGISTLQRWTEEMKSFWRQNGQLPVSNSRTGQEMPLDLVVLEDAEKLAAERDIPVAVEGLTIPYLVVHGDEDETVPFTEASVLHDSSPRGIRKLQIIPGGDHTFGARHPFQGTTDDLDEALRVTLDWFQSRL